MCEPPSKRNKLTPDQQKKLDDLEEIQEKLDSIQDDNFSELRRLEKRYEQMQKPFLQQRNQIADTIPKFWFISLTKHPKLCKLARSTEDEAKLKYLNKIEVINYDNNVGFCIKFFFDDNPYFKNKVLSKEYRKYPTSFSRHSPILWKNVPKQSPNSSKNQNFKNSKRRIKGGFFGWYTDFRTRIETDEISRMLREELWKNPLVFYCLPLTSDHENDDNQTDVDDTITNPLISKPSTTSMVPKLQVRPLLVCGPSGSGKSTLLKRLFQEYPDKFGFTVSHTTRKPRQGEENGRHYHFTDEDSMKKDIDEGKFIENAVFGGNHYGTSYASVEAVAKSGKIVVLDIDVQGVKQVKSTDLNPWSVFIRPPSMEVLKNRLVDRKTETPESLQRRLNRAEEELKYGLEPGNFDIIITNDDFSRAYKEFKDFVVDKVLPKGE